MYECALVTRIKVIFISYLLSLVFVLTLVDRYYLLVRVFCTGAKHIISSIEGIAMVQVCWSLFSSDVDHSRVAPTLSICIASAPWMFLLLI